MYGSLSMLALDLRSQPAVHLLGPALDLVEAAHAARAHGEPGAEAEDRETTEDRQRDVRPLADPRDWTHRQVADAMGGVQAGRLLAEGRAHAAAGHAGVGVVARLQVAGTVVDRHVSTSGSERSTRRARRSGLGLPPPVELVGEVAGEGGVGDLREIRELVHRDSAVTDGVDEVTHEDAAAD